MATSQYSLSTEALIPTIPLFTLAGYFMAESQASKRLVRVFQAMVGQYRAGPAMVTLLVCAFLPPSGSSGVYPCSGSTLASSLVGGSVWRKTFLV